MRFGIDISQHQLTWPEILDRARWAETAGFEGAWVFDHFKALYGDPSGPCMDGWSLLAALGAATEKIRLGALVTGMTYRHPSILAAQAVTVDHVSAGRLELGLGASWFVQEHHEMGIDFPSTRDRIARLEEGIQVIRAMMTGDDASFEGRHYRLDGASYNPKPVQQPHPPIWIGGSGEKLMLPLVGRQADVWHSFGRPETFRRKSAIVDRAAEAAGRDPSSIVRACSLSISEPFDEVRRTADELVAAGAGYLIVSWPTEGFERLVSFVEDVMWEIGSPQG